MFYQLTIEETGAGIFVEAMAWVNGTARRVFYRRAANAGAAEAIKAEAETAFLRNGWQAKAN